MYRTKQSVDKHVANITGRIKDERERLNRGYQFAKLYYDVKEYEIAKRYLAGFLAVQENYAAGHKLMGQILEKLQDHEKAVEAFKCSLQIDTNQKDVLLKICELYCKIDIDPERARYWAERAEKIFKDHEIVFRLREKMYANGDGKTNAEELEALITSELIKRPGDSKLRGKLLRLYVDTGRVNEAYTHAVDVEKRMPYADNLDWYQCLLDVYQVYERQTGVSINGFFHRNLLLAQHALVSLTLESPKVAEAAEALHKLDQSLFTTEKNKMHDKESRFVIDEIKAQFFFHIGTLVLKRAQLDHIGWKEASYNAALCYLYSYSVGLPSLKEPWLQNMTYEEKQTYQNLYRQAAYRISQTGHMIKVLCSGDNEKWMSKIHKHYSSRQNLEKLYDILFTLRHMKSCKSTSFLLSQTNFTNFRPCFPDDNHLRSVDKVAYKLKPESLHHIVWLALQYFSIKDTTQPAYNYHVFENLQMSVDNLDCAGSETLCQLDTDAFVYGVVCCAASVMEEKANISSSISSPAILPASIMPPVINNLQQEWWSTAYKLYTNSAKEQLGKMRQVLQRGLECIRLVDDRGMPPALTVHLARTFEERANEMKAKGNAMEATALENRAHHYWKKSLLLLERLKSNQNLPVVKYILFPPDGLDLSREDVNKHIAEGQYSVALFLMNCGEQEQALQQFEQVNTVEAAYYQSQIYRKIAEDEGGNIADDYGDSDVQQRQIALLEKARDSLYVAMDRTKGSRNHKLIPKLSSEIDDIEARIARLQLGGRDRSISECSEDGSVVPEPTRLTMQDTNRGISILAQSTPRPKPLNLDLSLGSPAEHSGHIRPSPERIDAQMRSIAQNSDMLIKHFMKQNEKLEKEKSDIAAELRDSRVTIDKLKVKVEKLEKKVAELQAAPPAAGAQVGLQQGLAQQGLAQPGMMQGTPSPLPTPQQQAMLAAASPDPRLRPHLSGIAAAAPHLAFYAYRPEYDFGAQAAFSPHSYPMYAPQVQVQYGYPSPGQLHNPGLRQPAPQMMMGENGDDIDDVYGDDDDDYRDEDGASEPRNTRIPDSQLIQDWPCGNTVGLEGKSTLAYSPTQRPSVADYLGSRGMSGLYPGGQAPTMPGPGYFSSPERPSMMYNTARYSSPQVGMAPSVMAAASSPLQPPRPGFLAPASAPTTMQPAAPAGLAGNLGINQLSKVGSPIVQQVGSPSVIESPSSAAIAAGQKYATNFPIVITSSVSTAVSSKTGTTLATATPAQQPPVVQYSQHDDDDQDGEVEDTYQGPDFEPLIPLPDEVEVKTGEEEEKVLFASRAKLFRFIDKQWKERGLGDIKILYREDTNQARIVMRREQVLKVCANHYVKADAIIEFKEPADHKVLTWQALDYSDDEPRLEQFCCKFKTDQLGMQFKTSFEEARDKVKNGKAKVAVMAAEKPGANENPFDKFKPKPGSWECTGCYVVNIADVTVCPACSTRKPGTQAPATPAFTPSSGGGFKISSETSTTSGFGSATSAFGSTNTPSTTPAPKDNLFDKFKPKAGSWECTGCYVVNNADVAVCPACQKLKPGTQPPAKPTFTPSAGGGFKIASENTATFGAPAASSSAAAVGFGALTTGTPVTTAATKPSGFSFGAATNSQAGYGAPAASAAAVGIGSSAGSLTAPAVTKPITFGTPTTVQPALTKGTPIFTPATQTPSPSTGFTFGKASSGTSAFTGIKPTPTTATDLSVKGTAVTTTVSTTTTTQTGFTFGSSAPTKSLFGSSTETTTKPSIFSGSSFTFGSSSTTATASHKPFSFGTSGTPASDLLKNIATKQGDSESFGGFTFTSKPMIADNKEKAAEEKAKPIAKPGESKEKEQPKTNVFANFSFSPSKERETSTSSPAITSSLFSSASSMTSFADMAKSGEKQAFTKQPDFKGFGGAGQQLFQSPTTTSTKDEGDGEEAADEEYEPQVDFKPVVPLPDLIEVKTGEEDEEKLFSARAKLFRHDPETKQWKERGVGELKILRHRETKRCRILMRREQVLKLCANHFISKDMKLSAMMSSDKAWCWFAQDYSEGEVSNDQLAARFKTAELANQFKQVFQQCQQDATSAKPSEQQDSIVTCPGKSGLIDLLKTDKEKKKPVTAKADSTIKGFGGMFKPKAGEWECQGCYVKNKADVVICPACNTLKPGAEAPASEKPAPSITFGSSGGFTLQGAQSTTSSGFGAPSSGAALGLGTKPAGFSFNPTTSTTTGTSGATPTTTATTTGFMFGSGGFSFNMASTTPASSTASTKTDTSPVKYVFGKETSFTFTPVTPQPRTRQDSNRSRQDSVTIAPRSPDGDEYYESEGDDSHIYFEPLVHLEKVEVKTGEEEEITLYCHRAKLYRFTNNEWKERGLGDVKLLQHKETGKVRVLMRREKILKLCLNHRVTPDLELKTMANSEGKAWVWHALDYSESEPSHEQFAIRFKSKEVADNFKKVFDDAKSGSAVTPVKSEKPKTENVKTSNPKSSEFSFTSPNTTTGKSAPGFKFTPPKLTVDSIPQDSAGSKPTPGSSNLWSGSKPTSVFGGGSQPTTVFGSAGQKASFGQTPLSKGKGLLASLLEGNADVEITHEEKPSAELQQKARGFGLPDTFYNYEKKAPCPGCPGCDTDDCTGDPDVEFVKIETATQDQQVKAKKFKLPDNFYLYRTRKPCPGCIGCRDDNEDVFSQIGKAPMKVKEETKSEPDGAESPVPTTVTKTTEAEGFSFFTQAAVSSFSFADIAKKSEGAFKKDTSKPFSWEGTGKQVFRQVPTVVDDVDDGEVVPSQDIHFEPLVQLPEVEVKTGEEDEELLYSHRAKLFRYTDNQWKERGVGDIKLLKHRDTGRVRILMRREQIHKLCCNHAVTPDMVLRPLATSETAWCWHAMDYTDSEGKFEQFALRFKTKEIAETFKEKFEECQAMVSVSQAADTPAEGNNSRVEEIGAGDYSTSQVTDQSRTDQSQTDQSQTDQSHNDESRTDDDDEYEDEEDPLFQKRATLHYIESGTMMLVGMGELCILYDADVNGARIQMVMDHREDTEEQTLVINHIICMEHHLHTNEKQKFCEWTAQDFSNDTAVKKTFHVTFSSKNTVHEFKQRFKEGKELARDSSLREIAG